MKFFTTKHNNVIDLVEFLDHCDTVKDGSYEIEIKRNVRPNNKNRYYWGVLVPFIQNSIEAYGGWDLEDIHEWLKLTFNFKIKDLLGNEEKIAQTTRMPEDEFDEYLNRIYRYFDSIGIVIPKRGEMEKEVV
jgi:hypothetical protein